MTTGFFAEHLIYCMMTDMQGCGWTWLLLIMNKISKITWKLGRMVQTHGNSRLNN
jgi:hypothetical protein